MKEKILNLLYVLSEKLKHRFRPLDSSIPMMSSFHFDPMWQKIEKPILSSGNCSKNCSVIYLMSPTQRSGTNYLAYLIEQHPIVNALHGEELPKEDFSLSYSSYLQKYCVSTIGNWGNWLENPNIAATYTKHMLNSMGNGLLSFYYSHIEPDKTLLLRTPDSLHISRFPLLFPEGKLVILIRDGRDTVESFVKSWGGKSYFKQMCIRWANRVNEINNLAIQVESADASPFYKIVKYNDLVESTEATLRDIFGFLKLPKDSYDWSKLSEAPVLGSSIARGDRKEVNWNPVQKTKDFSPLGRWKKWSSREKRVFKRYAGKQLIQWGFEDTNDW